MLSSLKAIKMTGADKRAAAVIENLRLLEFAASRMFRRLGVAGLISCESDRFGYLPQIISSVSLTSLPSF